jgi:hypothetical protein
VTPYITKHYGIGLLVGIGIGLFVAGMLARSGDSGMIKLLVPVGLVLAITGGVVYTLDVRKPRG